MQLRTDPHEYPPTSFCLKFSVHSLDIKKKFQNTAFLQKVESLHSNTTAALSTALNPTPISLLLPYCRITSATLLSPSHEVGVDFLGSWELIFSGEEVRSSGSIKMASKPSHVTKSRDLAS